MPERSRPVVVSTRVSRGDRQRIGALAELEGTSVSEALYEILTHVVPLRLAELVSLVGQSPRSSSDAGPTGSNT